MNRLALLLRNEFNLFRTAPIIHLIAILQPTLMFLLMAAIMVVPTIDMRVLKPTSEAGLDLIAAMDAVTSPIGPDYIETILVEENGAGHKQIIEIIDQNGKKTALQRYGFIDSNLVKNLRNRLTAALLLMWNNDLGEAAVQINEHPWLPIDISYTVYFGMAMIPLASYLAAAMIGGYLMAQEFEHGTILSYRLCPSSIYLQLAAKLIRLLVTGLAAAGLLYVCLGLMTGVWGRSPFQIILILIPLTLIAACIGLIAGLLTRSTLPSFLISLASAFLFWLVGSGFGLAAGFSDLFEKISRFLPNTPVVEMMFPQFYFGRQVAAHPQAAKIQLAGYSLILLAATLMLYRQRVVKPHR